MALAGRSSTHAVWQAVRQPGRSRRGVLELELKPHGPVRREHQCEVRGRPLAGDEEDPVLALDEQVQPSVAVAERLAGGSREPYTRVTSAAPARGPLRPLPARPGVVVDLEWFLLRAQRLRHVLQVDADPVPEAAAAAHPVDQDVERL